MVSGRTQHRSLLLLIAVVGVQVLLLAAQIKRDQDVRLIRVWAVELVSPLGRTATWLSDAVRDGWTNYVAVHSVSKENAELRAELSRLKLRNAELEGRAAEAERLGALLGFRQQNASVPMMAARVIGASPSASNRVVFIDRGSGDGLAADMGVITPDGVIGKILAVYPATSQVLLISDKESGVGALLAGTRTQAPVRGSGENFLTMEYVSKEVKVVPGERVLTSGQDRIFPRDLPVGTVVQTDPDVHGSFQKIVVKPAARLDRIEEVLVLLTRQELAPQTAAAGPSGSFGASAADSKASAKPAAAAPAVPKASPAVVSPQPAALPHAEMPAAPAASEPARLEPASGER